VAITITETEWWTAAIAHVRHGVSTRRQPLTKTGGNTAHQANTWRARESAL
jgi:hypothetical protein